MQINRGPRMRPVSDWNDSHKLVDNLDLSEKGRVQPWHQRTVVEDVNITIAGERRKSTIDIILERKDVVALNNALVKGLVKRSKKLDSSEKRISRLVEALREIRGVATSAKSQSKSDSFETIRKTADIALKRL